MMHLRLITPLTFFLFAPFMAHAEVDARIEGAKMCTKHMPRYEREYGVPTHLLSAIASTETGRWNSTLKIVLPWPWTINAEGKGYFFDTKQEAIQAAKNLKMRGVKSMDLGCMQVNTYHHPNAFRSIEDAFDPQQNVAYAASFLRTLYESEGSWKSAAAAYHSKTPERGAQYLGLVYNKWITILERLRMPKTPVQQAAVQVAPSTVMKKNPVQLNRLPESHTTAMMMPPKSRLTEQSGKRLNTQQPVRMKVIEVAKTNKTREGGVIVVRPDVDTKATLQIASIKSSESTVTSTAATRSGPRFIFNE
jgi:hypothetical protein